MTNVQEEALAMQRAVAVGLRAQRSAAIVRLAKQGLTIAVIMRRVKCSADTATAACKAAGVTMCRKTAYPVPEPSSRPGIERTPGGGGRWE